MGFDKTTTTVPMIDNGTAVKIFAAGLGRVDVIGQNARFVLFVPVSDETDGSIYNVVEAHVVVPLEAVAPAIELTVRTLGLSLAAPTARYLTDRLLHS